MRQGKNITQVYRLCLQGQRCKFYCDSLFCPAEARFAPWLCSRLSCPHTLSHPWQRDSFHEQNQAPGPTRGAGSVTESARCFSDGHKPRWTDEPARNPRSYRSSTAPQKRLVKCLPVSSCANILTSQAPSLLKTENNS